MSRHIALPLAAAVSFLLVLGGPAGAQTQNGLVNIYVSDVTAQVPISVAANVCDVSVNVLSEFVDTSDTACTATAVSTAVHNDNSSSNGPNQEGLVNVALTDVTIQAPISVAANVCDVAVNVLARDLSDGTADCDALAASAARH